MGRKEERRKRILGGCKERENGDRHFTMADVQTKLQGRQEQSERLKSIIWMWVN